MRPLKQGTYGREVEDIQTRLGALGYDLGPRGIDGVFSTRTELAVRQFQRKLGITADGVVDSITFREMVEASYHTGDRLLYLRQPPLRGADVMELQRMLNDLGFDPGAVNGLFDGRTVRAVKEFQSNAGLEVDGVVNYEVFRMVHTLAAQTLGTHPFPDKNGGYFPEDFLAGTVLVDAARGGEDTGYITPEGLRESDLNLAVALELERTLTASQVLLTRRYDEEISYSDRAFMANTSAAKMVVSIQHGRHHTPNARGTTCFFFERLGYHSHRGRMSAAYVQRSVSRALDTVDIGTFGRSYEMLRETNIPAVMVEPLHLTNPEELKLAEEDSYPASVANAISEGLRLYASRDKDFIAV